MDKTNLKTTNVDGEYIVNGKFSPLAKILSGRFLATITACIGFLFIINTLSDLLLEKSELISMDDITNLMNLVIIIISNILTFYFARDRDSKKPNDAPVNNG